MTNLIKSEKVARISDTVPPKPNLLINGGFDVWQRGTSHTLQTATPTVYSAAGAYHADRFTSGIHITSSGSLTLERQYFTLGQTDVPNNPESYLKITGNNLTDNGTDSLVTLDQPIEDVRNLAGKKATVSFYAKTDNTQGRKYSVGLWQNFGSASANVLVPRQDVDLTTSWQHFVLTFDVPSVAGKNVGVGNYLGLYSRLVSKGTDLARTLSTTTIPDLGNDSVSIAQVKLEEGSTFTGWPQVDPATELVKCQRYYVKMTTRVPVVYDAGLSKNRSIINFPVPMRSHTMFNILSYTAEGHAPNNTQPTVHSNNLYGGVDIGSSDQAYRQYGHQAIVTISADAEL